MKHFGTILSRDRKTEHNVWIELDDEGNVIDWNCTCTWGSIGRFQKKKIDKPKCCWHIFKFIKELNGKNGQKS